MSRLYFNCRNVEGENIEVNTKLGKCFAESVPNDAWHIDPTDSCSSISWIITRILKMINGFVLYHWLSATACSWFSCVWSLSLCPQIWRSLCKILKIVRWFLMCARFYTVGLTLTIDIYFYEKMRGYHSFEYSKHIKCLPIFLRNEQKSLGWKKEQ